MKKCKARRQPRLALFHGARQGFRGFGGKGAPSHLSPKGGGSRGGTVGSHSQVRLENCEAVLKSLLAFRSKNMI